MEIDVLNGKETSDSLLPYFSKESIGLLSACTLIEHIPFE